MPATINPNSLLPRIDFPMSAFFPTDIVFPNRYDILTSATTNNQPIQTIFQLLNIPSLTPATQKNFWGKSSGADRITGIIGGGGGGTIQSIYAGGTQNANATATAANLPICWKADRWVWLIAQFSFGTSILPRLFFADYMTGGPVTEAFAYSTQTAGSGTHDDSANPLSINAASAGGNNPFDTRLAFHAVINRYLSASEMNDFINYPSWIPGAVLLLPMCGRSLEVDQSGMQNHGLAANAPVPGPALPYRPISRRAYFFSSFIPLVGDGGLGGARLAGHGGLV